jgi:N-acyl-L-homoserine lactone synthetase
MITYVSYDNLDLTGKAFNSQFQLRHRCFIERQRYNVRNYNKKEYDQYDTPAAVYLVYQGANGAALGASRMTPTSHSCMLRDLWPEMVEQKQTLCSREVWEGTRFCIEKDIDPALRKRIANELVLAYVEFGLELGIKRIIGLMPKLILRSVFKTAGVDFEPLGPSKIIDDITTQAAGMSINTLQLIKIRKATGIHYPVLYTPEVEKRHLEIA